MGKELRQKYQRACERLIVLHAYEGINRVPVLPIRKNRGVSLVISQEDGQAAEIGVESWRVGGSGEIEYEHSKIEALTEYWERHRFVGQATVIDGEVWVSFSAMPMLMSTRVKATPLLIEQLHLPKFFDQRSDARNLTWLTRAQMTFCCGEPVEKVREMWMEHVGPHAPAAGRSRVPYLGRSRDA